MQLNIQGLLNKQGRLSELIDKTHTDAVLLCETWLNKESEKLVALDNYKLFSNHRIDRLRGGVGILINKNLQSRVRLDLNVETKHLEHINLELKTDTKNILLVSGYRPPNANAKVFIKEYTTLLTNLRKLKHHEIILGIDHNLDLLKAHHHSQTSQFLEKTLDLDLTPCISKPTRITIKTATLIDNIMASPRLQIEIPT